MRTQNLYERLKPHHKDQILLELKVMPNVTADLIHALTDNHYLNDVEFYYITSLCSICTNMNFNEVWNVFEEPKLIPND